MALRKVVAAVSLVTALALGASYLGVDRAEASAQNPAGQSGSQPQMNRPDMMKMHQEMMAAMKAGDARLDALVKEMNAATGEARIATITAVVNELVQQHKGMHGRMARMHEQMMSGGRGMMRGQ